MNDNSFAPNDRDCTNQSINESSARRHVMVASGFIPRSEIFHRLYNLTIGLFLFLVGLPLFLMLCGALYATQGKQIFYRGLRIGRGGRRFRIIKFRTLDEEKARALTQNNVLPSDSGIETPLGVFLRETRLDELPQLLNVIRGEMNICGPRPVRAEIASISRRSIRNYDDRFLVKPGLIGHTQACFWHGTSKAVRARFNSLLCRAHVNYLYEIGFVAVVGCCVLARTASKVWTKLRNAVSTRFLGIAPVDTAVRRAKGLAVQFIAEGGTRIAVTRIDKERLILDGPLHGGLSKIGRLEMTLPDGQRRLASVALQEDSAQTPPGQAIYAYEVEGDLSTHMASRYLFQSVVVPHRSYLLGARLYRFVAGPTTSPSFRRVARALRQTVTGLFRGERKLTQSPR